MSGAAVLPRMRVDDTRSRPAPRRGPGLVGLVAVLALAEPYLSGPRAVCEREPEPQVNYAEQVHGDLGQRWIGLFSTTPAPELTRHVRRASRTRWRWPCRTPSARCAGARSPGGPA